MIAAFIAGYGCGALASIIVCVINWRKYAREQVEKHQTALGEAAGAIWEQGYNAGYDDGRNGEVH